MRPVEISLRANTAFRLIAQRRQDEIEVPNILTNEKGLWCCHAVEPDHKVDFDVTLLILSSSLGFRSVLVRQEQ